MNAKQKMGRTLVRVTAIMLLAACGTARLTTTPAVTDRVPQPNLGNSLDWIRRSAEHRAVMLQTFAFATRRIEEVASGRAPNTWAVILDVDETVLDDSRYQQEQTDKGEPFSNDAWWAYARREASDAMPGAVDFLRRVHALGGKVVIVTNRAPFICDATRSQLRKVDLEVDAVLCRDASGSGDKNPRFRAVEAGTADPALPPLNVLMYVGDNIFDFPELSQALRQQPDSAFSKFGREYIILPNPMYGSWQ